MENLFFLTSLNGQELYKSIACNLDNPSYQVSTDFTLSALLIRAGINFAIPKTYYYGVSATLQRHAGTRGSETITQTGFSDFYHTGGFASVSVPSGVTWTSSSGVFLSNTTVIPEPGTIILLSAGFLGLSLLVWCHRCKA